MAKLIALAKLKLKDLRYTIPHIRNYNRLEGSPRSQDFQRNLSMESHDPLWFLCRQWQFGEFQAEDAATAFQATVLGVHTTPGEIEVGSDKKYPMDNSMPLETSIEREILLPTLQLRAQMGRHLVKLFKQHKMAKYVHLLAEEFSISDEVKADDEEGLFLAVALPKQIPDGYQVNTLMRTSQFEVWFKNHADVEITDHDILMQCQVAFLNWFNQLYQQPEEDEAAWNPARLEYSFSLRARHEDRGARQLIADQYSSGHLDWKDFDQKNNPRQRNLDTLSKPEEITQTFIPTQLSFSGMPHPRLWQMEEGKTNFGKINASPTSVMNILLAEYGLNYSNDWFVLPYELSINTICQIKGILLTDVFGQHIFVKPAIQDPETSWHEFAMFHQTERDNATRNESIFYLAPTIGQKLESEDIERVNFIRDEMSNMVWAIEQVVTSDAGNGRILKREVPSLDAFEPVGDVAKIRYVLGNTVPDNWIPFIPVHKPVAAGQVPREIRLQRSRMPQATGAQGKFLTEVQPTYFIEEEEVPRAGVIVSRRFQRTRWLNGKTLLWMGRSKRAGRGEGSANLKYDEILN